MHFAACGDPPCNYAATSTDYGDFATIDCPEGTVASDATATVECLADGSWSSPTDRCNPVGMVDQSPWR